MSAPPPVIGLDARKAADFGIGTYTRGLVAALAANSDAREFRFVLFVRPKDRSLFEDLPGNFSLEIADFPGYSISELTLFASRVRRRRLALFHALHYVLPPFLSTRSVVTVHDLIHLHPEHLPRPWASPYARLMIRSALSRAQSVIAVSESTRREIVRRFPFAAGKVAVVPEGVGGEFRPGDAAGDGARLSAKYHLPARYALFLGGERPHKNLARVVEAFELAARTDPSLGLVLAGPLPRAWRAGARFAPDLADRVRVLGVVPQEDLPGLYAAALLFLYPTLQEGFGLPAVEAMASGTPVITSEIPVWRETCGDAAILVDPRDPRAIAEAVSRLAASPEERDGLRRRGLERAAAFTWAATGEKTLQVYRKAL